MQKLVEDKNFEMSVRIEKKKKTKNKRKRFLCHCYGEERQFKEHRGNTFRHG